MLVVDADSHVEESEATWEYLDPKFRPYRPLPLVFDEDTYHRNFNAVWLIEGRVHPKLAGPGWHIFATPPLSELARSKAASIGAQSMTDVPSRLADMDRMGIDVQVVLPSLFLTALADDQKLDKALCQSYNRFMGQACGHSGGRIRFLAVLPMRDMADALEVLREAKRLGAVGAFSHGMVWDRHLGDPFFNPLYEELSALDMPLIVHFGWGSPSLNNLVTPDQASSFFSATLPVVMGFHTLIGGGVFERFPPLRVAFLEAGCEWLPFILRSMDTRSRINAFPTLKRKPSEYVQAGNIFFACEADEDIPYVLKHIGEDQLVTASDYPHADPSEQEDMVHALGERGDLSAELQAKILSANPTRLYNIDPAAVSPRERKVASAAAG